MSTIDNSGFTDFDQSHTDVSTILTTDNNTNGNSTLNSDFNNPSSAVTSSTDDNNATIDFENVDVTADYKKEKSVAKNDNEEEEKDNESVLSNEFSNSELEQYEPFFADEVSKEKDNETNVDDSMLIQKAVTYPVDKSEKDGDKNSNNTEDTSSTMGARKEKDIIESLTHENFQLKLRIVVVESQLQQASGEGVADLRKQLADAQAAKIAAQHESSKLRKTLGELNSNKDREYEQQDVEKDIRIKTLEENLSFYQYELEELRRHCEGLEQTSLDRETQYEDALRQERSNSRALQDQLKQSERYSTPLRKYDNFSAENLTRRTFSDDGTPPPDRGYIHIQNQVDNIKRILTGSASRSRSRLSAASFTGRDSAVDNMNMEAFSDMLRQIQDSAHLHNSKHSALKRELDTLSEDYENLVGNFERVDANFEQVLAELRETHDAEMSDLLKQMASKDDQIEKTNEELEDVWRHMNELKSSLSDLEDLRVESEELTEQSKEYQNEVFKLKSELNSKSMELEGLKNEKLKLVEELEELKNGGASNNNVLENVLTIVRESYDEKADVSTVVDCLTNAFKLVSEVEQTVAQVHETLAENERLAKVLDENEVELGNSKKELEDAKSKLEDVVKEKQNEQDGLDDKVGEYETKLKKTETDLNAAHDELKIANEKLASLQTMYTEIEDKKKEQVDELTKEKQDALKHVESLKNNYEQLKNEREEISKELKNLQEQLYYETSRNEALEKKVTSLNKNSRLGNTNSTNNNNNAPMLGQLDVSQTFKQQTYERMNELQKSIDKLQLTKNQDATTIKTLESRLHESRENTLKCYKLFLQKLYPQLDENLSKKVDSIYESMNNNSSSSSINFSSLEQLSKEALEYVIESMNKSLRQQEKRIHRLNEQLTQPMDKLDKLQKSGGNNNGEVRKEIFKQISGTFVGKIWLSRYHEMEKRWHNERETRRREYDGYKQHLNECYERIEAQKKQIGKLQQQYQQKVVSS